MVEIARLKESIAKRDYIK